MRLLKPHSHTSNRPGYEARKTPKKKLKETQTLEEGKPSVKTCRVPPVWRGGTRRKRRYGKTNHRQNPPAYRRRGGGGETKKGELKENTGAKTRKTKVKTLPQATIVARRGETKKNNVHHKEKKTKHTLCE